MKVSLNLKPLPTPEDVHTLADLLQFVETQGLPAGHVIKRIVIDGEELDEEGERRLLSESLGQIELIEFYSARPVDLAAEGLTDATQLLPSLAEDLMSAAGNLRAGNVKDGLVEFSVCVDIITWYVGLIDPVDIIFSRRDPSFRLAPEGATDDGSPESDLGDLGAEEAPELKTFASIENLRQKLMSVEQAQRDNDTLLLADLIEHEILPIVNIWIAEVPVLLKKVEREKGTA